MAQARRRRGPGSLSQLKGYLWAAIAFELSVVEDEEASRDSRHKAVNGLTQASLAYIKLFETSEVEARVQAIEAAIARERSP